MHKSLSLMMIQTFGVLIRIHLEEVVTKVEEAKGGQEAIQQLMSDRFDLMLLDLMMDDMNGLEILRFVRSKGIDTPVIIISAIAEIDKKVETLGLGADDYVTKPFMPSELVARALANIRRSRQTLTLFNHDRIQVGMMTLDMNAQTLEKNYEIFLYPRQNVSYCPYSCVIPAVRSQRKKSIKLCGNMINLMPIV